MLITVGFAGGAVYYGTNGTLDGQQSVSNEIDLPTPEKIEKNKPVSKPENGAENNPVTTSRTTKITGTTVIVESDDHPPQGKPEKVEAPKQPVSQVTPEPSEPMPAPVGENIDLARIMPMLMEQAEKISTPEIKDQAYLDVVNFSVGQRQFKFADAAMQKIHQPELRDTARSQIAIGLAMVGRADDAFEVIDAVEIDTLRDVMRLQVIEAIIVPGKLPPGLVRQ